MISTFQDFLATLNHVPDTKTLENLEYGFDRVMHRIQTGEGMDPIQVMMQVYVDGVVWANSTLQSGIESQKLLNNLRK